MSIKSNIPQQLKKLRKSLAMTQQQFADRVKISRSLLSQIEGGRSGLTLDRALEICKTLNISIDELIGNATTAKAAARQITVAMNAEGVSVATGEIEPEKAIEMLKVAIGCLELKTKTIVAYGNK